MRQSVSHFFPGVSREAQRSTAETPEQSVQHPSPQDACKQFILLYFFSPSVIETASVSRLVTEVTAAPPAGAGLKVRCEAAVDFSTRLWGLTVIVSAFVSVGAQRCWAHVEPHSHSSNTHIFTKTKQTKKQQNCLWYQYPVCEQQQQQQQQSSNIPDNYCSAAAAITEICALVLVCFFVFWQQCILYLCICPTVTWDLESNIILIHDTSRGRRRVSSWIKT